MFTDESVAIKGQGIRLVLNQRRGFFLSRSARTDAPTT